MDRLTGLDGAFLSLESPTTHLHIVGALILEPDRDRDTGAPFERIRSTVVERLPLVPPFRKRMVEVPFGLQHPSMVDDPDFDIDYHLRRVGLPAPGTRDELAVLVAEIASHPLDRNRPLWEFHVVEGLEAGRLALVAKVHHSIIDGVSAADVLAAFFDLSPEPGPQPLFAGTGTGRSRRQDRNSGLSTDRRGRRSGRDPSWTPEPIPGELQQWWEVIGSLPGHADALLRTVSRSFQIARTRGSGTPEVGPGAPPAPFEAPRTSINVAISPHRRVALASLPMGDVRRVRDVLGGTTNDVVLTVVSGAMRTFFAERGEELDSSLVAMVPVSVRTESERGALGNRVSALLVSLATGAEDAAGRLGQIRDGMEAAKERSRPVTAELLSGWAQALFPAVATRLSRLVTNLRLFDHVGPLFNLVVSNVPGPSFPLYLAGTRLVAMYPFGPIVEGVGVNVTVFSYEDTVFVGVLACWDLGEDIETIARGMEESLGELVEQANRRDRPVPWWHAELPA